MYDVIIIGSGVSGSSVARELSRYKAKILVLEKEADVCNGSSKANSGIAHAGYDAESGTLKAKLNVAGHKLMDTLSKELDFPFKKTGSLVLCFDKNDIHKLEELKERGIKNGVQNLSILNRDEILAIEPNISDKTCAALYAPDAGIVCPFRMNIAFAENAHVNGVEFKFNTEVTGFEKSGFGWMVQTNTGMYETKVVINAAGLYSARLHNMVSEDKLNIIFRRGDYLLLDKKVGNYVKQVNFQLPSKYGKGVLIAPTIDNNIIVGPTAIDVDAPEYVNTTREGLDTVIERAARSIKNIPFGSAITSFAGLRAHEEKGEFVIKEVEDAPLFFDCVGIESPGLTSSPALGIMVADMVQEKMHFDKKENFQAIRKAPPVIKDMDTKALNELIKNDSRYGHIICRCEMVSEGEIVNAIHRPLGATNLDALKRRVRVMAGRCQGGFCTPRLLEILSRELNITQEKLCKNSKGSEMLIGRTK